VFYVFLFFVLPARLTLQLAFSLPWWISSKQKVTRKGQISCACVRVCVCVCVYTSVVCVDPIARSCLCVCSRRRRCLEYRKRKFNPRRCYFMRFPCTCWSTVFQFSAIERLRTYCIIEHSHWGLKSTLFPMVVVACRLRGRRSSSPPLFPHPARVLNTGFFAVVGSVLVLVLGTRLPSGDPELARRIISMTFNTRDPFTIVSAVRCPILT